MKKLFTLLILLTSSIVLTAQPVLPIDYESSIDYQITNFDGGDLSVIPNPDMRGINTSATVSRMIKNSGQPWGGAFMTLAEKMDFENNNTFKVQVWSPEAGRNVLLKVENQNDPGINFEMEEMTTVAGAWEEITFDYSAINSAETYDRIIFIFDNGTEGDGSANFTFFLDDIRLVFEANETNEVELPIDFEQSIDYQITNFDGGELTVIPNPDMSGINTTATVGRMVKNAGQPWGGAFITTADPLDFNNNNTFKVKVWSPEAGRNVLLKVENIADPGQFFEMENATTTSNAWEEMSFDFTGINTANEYQKIIFIFDNGTVGDGSANFTWYLDDIELVMEGGAMNDVELPIDFEQSIDYQITNFDGGDLTVVTNPDMSGINTSATVGQMVKNAGQPWGGAFITVAEAMDFMNNNTFKVKVWSPQVGRNVLLKVENVGNPGQNFEMQKATTIANGWEEMSFDFTGINTANTYQNIIFIFDNGTVGDGSANFTWYLDDIKLVFENTMVEQPALPLTFEDDISTYSIRDFDGAVSEIVTDPTDASNRVLQTIKTDGAAFFAGTVLADFGTEEPMPFTMDASIMSVRVWSPDAGIPVRLKVENSADPTQSVETETSTTLAGEWEILEFDVNNEVMGTAALNESYTFDKIVIFYNFGQTGAVAGEKTYYSDDFTFGMISSTENVSAQDAGITIFPNPVTDFVRIDLPAELSSQQLTAKLYDFRGALVQQTMNILDGSRISVQALPAGNYMLILETENTSYNQMIMIQK